MHQADGTIAADSSITAAIYFAKTLGIDLRSFHRLRQGYACWLIRFRILPKVNILAFGQPLQSPKRGYDLAT